MLDLHTLLQLGETGDSIFEGDDFAIDDERSSLLMLEGSDQFWIFRIQQLLIAGEELDSLFVLKHQAAYPIQFRFEQPSFARKSLIRQRRQHRRKPAGLLGLSKFHSRIGWQIVWRLPLVHC